MNQHSKVTFVHRFPTFWPWLICALGALFYCYEYLLRVAPSVMSSDLMDVYHLDGAGFGNLVAFYYYAYTPMQLFVGVFMDRYGPRLLITIACLLCAVGTFLFSIGHALYIAQVGRFLVGFGSAFAFVGALKLATIWLPENRFAMISGLITALGMVGAMLADDLMSMLVQTQGWQATSIMSVVVGVILAFFIILIVRDSKGKKVKAIDQTDFRHVIKGLIIALRRKQIWLNGLIGCLLYLPVSVFAELWGVDYLREAHGFSSVDAAFSVSMIFLGWAIGGPIVGFISDRIGRRLLPMMVGCVLSFIFICIVLYVPGLPNAMIPVLFFGFGLATSVQIIVFAIGRESSPVYIAATALAVTNMLVMIGGDIFQPLVGKLLDLGWNGDLLQGVRVFSHADFTAALSIIPAGIVIAFVVLFFMKETYCQLRDMKK